MNFSSIQTTAAAAVDADASGVHLFSTETEKKDEGNILIALFLSHLVAIF